MTITHRIGVAGLKLTQAEYEASNSHSIGGDSGGVVRTATLVVAASNASTTSIAQADYVCDGTADDVQIQAAIVGLPASGGTVVLSEGTFVGDAFSNTVANVRILGQGRGKTTYQLKDSATALLYAIDIAADDCEISYLTIDGNKASNAAWRVALTIQFASSGGDRFISHDIEVKNSSGDGIFSKAVDCVFQSPYIHDCDDTGIVFGGLTTGTVYSHRNIAIAPIIDACAVGLDNSNDSDYCSFINPRVTNCTTHGIKATYTANGTRMPNYLTIAHPVVVGCGGDASGNAGINFVYSGSVGSKIICPTLVGCSRNGIALASAVKLMMPSVSTSYWHGIVFAADNCEVIGGEVFNNSTKEAGFNGITLEGDYNIVMGVRLYDNRGTPLQKWHINEATGKDYNVIVGNDVSGAVAATGAKIRTVGSNTIVKDNIGYVTENSGTATVVSGQTSIAVAHGLAATPTRVQITPKENPTNAVSFWWVDTVGATNFTINVNADPGASNLDFDWHAQVGEG